VSAVAVFGSGFGHIAVVDVPVAGAALPAAEVAMMASFGDRRRATFTAGRVALRAALRAAGVSTDVVDAAIARDDRGAPVLPAGVRGSVTHKDSIAGALVEVGGRGTVGIDVELDDGRDAKEVDDLARQVLTPREIAALPASLPLRRRRLFERFSLKEALYKAIDPWVRRYVGFKEVEVVDDADDDAAVSFAVAAVGAFTATGRVIAIGRPGIVLTVARVVPR
jgi:phosphopantetheine--protein transferase-like protein